MRNLIFVLLVVSFSSCAVQNEFRVTVAGEEPEGAVGRYYYVLPQTVLKVTLNIEEEMHLPGPYGNFATRFMGITDPVMEKISRYNVLIADIDFLKEPDPDMYFSVNLMQGSFTAEKYLRLTTQGLILDPSGWISHSGSVERYEPFDLLPAFTDLSVTGFFGEVTDTLFKTIITDTSFVRVPIPRRQLEVKTTEQKAQEAANFILEIRRARFELIAGEIDGFPSGDALEFTISELNRVEKQYLELFTGKKAKKTYVKTIFITPDGNAQNIVLETLREGQGAPAKNISIEIKPEGKTKSFQSTAKAQIPTNTFLYRIPDMASFVIKDGNNEIYEERALLYQAGKLVTLPVQDE